MTLQWNDAPDDLDMEEVRRLAVDFALTDPTNPNAVPAEPEVCWPLVFLCIVCAVLAPTLAWCLVQAVTHWVGTVQLVLATAALTWVCLAVDWVLATAWAWGAGLVPVTDTPTRSARMVSPAQIGKLMGLYRDLGITDRPARLADLNHYLCIEVTSTTLLTFDEAKMLIGHLQRRLTTKETT